jgi:hypothetical protein
MVTDRTGTQPDAKDALTSGYGRSLKDQPVRVSQGLVYIAFIEPNYIVCILISYIYKTIPSL